MVQSASRGRAHARRTSTGPAANAQTGRDMMLRTLAFASAKIRLWALVAARLRAVTKSEVVIGNIGLK
jgi:hypothetical protein